MSFAIEHVERPAAGQPEGALVLIHGRGADERDLFPLLDALDPDRRLHGFCPAGPLALPPGGRHWYVVERVGFPHRATFDPTLAALAAWLDALPVPLAQTVVGGFSQGAVMSYALGLGAGRPPPAGILAMSGFVPQVEGFAPDLAGRRGLPVAITHGAHDPVIPVELGRAARDELEAGGLAVAYAETPAPHTVDPALLPALRDWLPV